MYLIRLLSPLAFSTYMSFFFFFKHEIRLANLSRKSLLSNFLFLMPQVTWFAVIRCFSKNGSLIKQTSAGWERIDNLSHSDSRPPHQRRVWRLRCARTALLRHLERWLCLFLSNSLLCVWPKRADVSRARKEQHAL